MISLFCGISIRYMLNDGGKMLQSGTLCLMCIKECGKKILARSCFHFHIEALEMH